MRNDWIIHLISRLRDRVNISMMEEYKEVGLGDIVPAHGGIIYALGSQSELSMKELARLMQRDNSTITTLVDKLERLGYVTRFKSSEDGRVYRVRLTDKGQQAHKWVISISRKTLKKMYGGLDEEEQDQLVALLTKVYHNM